jgi:FkbM family methyltransferase
VIDKKLQSPPLNNKNAPWGDFAPSIATLHYRLITRLGLSRGAVCRWIRKKWTSNHSTIVDATIRGIKYRLDIKNNTTDSKILTSSKVYDEKEILSLSPSNVALAQKSGVFLDIGANTGYYSLTLADSFSRVVAIEPNPPALELLRYNVSINKMERKIEILPLCIGEGGKVPFYCSGGLGSASLIKSEDDVNPIWVDSIPLIDLLNSLGVSHINSMKIDIEGYEDKALFPFFKNAPKSLWPDSVVIESCNRSMWSHDIIEHMKIIGYREENQTRGNSILKKS